MKKLILTLIALSLAIACTQADEDQYKALGKSPVYGESNGVYYDATNDYLSLWINDAEIAYFDSSGNLTLDGSVAAQSLDPADDSAVCFGTSDDACFEFNAADMAPDSMVIGVGTESRQLIIGESADVSGAAAVDLAIAQQTNPTLNIHSADGTDANDYISMAHDQTNGVIDVGQGSIYLGATVISESNFTVGIGGAGVDYTINVNGENSDFLATWMEDEDQLKIADDLDLDGGVGAIDFSSDGASSILVADNDTTALIIGSSSDTGILTIDTGNDTETVVVNGFAAATALHVNVGTTLLDEDLTIGDNTNGVDYKITFDGNASDGVITWMEDETRIDVESNLEFGAGAAGVDYTFTANGEDNDGTITWMEDENQWKFTNDLDLAGGASAVTFSAASSSIEIPDNSATALSIGKNEAATALIVIDTLNSNEEVNIVGTTATSAFRVDTGFATFDEQAVFTAGISSAVTAADAITLTGAAPTMTLKNNEAAAFNINSSGTANFVLFDTTDNAEELNINGNVGVSTFRVDSGFATFDEQVVCTAGADMNGAVLFGGGAGAATFDAASSSVLMSGAADNQAAGLDIGATGLTNMMRFVTTDDAERITLGAGLVVGTTSNTAASNVTLDGSDCGKTHFMGSGMDGSSFLLPATIAGCQLQFVFVGADHAALLDLSPNASDAIHGTCVEMTGDTAVEFNGLDDNDIGCTKATCNTGDGITVMGDGAEGWYVTACNGIWANN